MTKRKNRWEARDPQTGKRQERGPVMKRVDRNRYKAPRGARRALKGGRAYFMMRAISKAGPDASLPKAPAPKTTLKPLAHATRRAT